MAKFLDLTGQRFGKLTVIKFSKDVQSGKRKRKYWLCQCDCGNTKEVRTDSLTSGNVKSCGCLHIENSYKNLTSEYGFKPKYQIQNKRLYCIWYGMKQRCCNSENENYPRYGGRGITICNEWLDFDNFAKWALSNGYTDNLSIDRIDNNGNYEPSNCRWVDIYTQANNKRDILQFHGIKGTKNVAKYLGISVRRFANMLYRDKMTLDEIYEKSKTDPLFYATNTERRSFAQRKRKDEWKINKEEAIEIVNNIKNGSSINREANRMKVDFKTIKTAIKRLEDGIYDL